MRPYKGLLNNNKGFTIVELLIVLVLLVMVISMGYNILGFGNTTFNKGESKANIQQNMRLLADYITKEVRIAYEIEILGADSSVPASQDIVSGDEYIFINDDGKLERRSSEGSTVFPDTLMPGKNLILSFGKSGNLLEIEITNTIDNTKIKTKIAGLNLAESIQGLNEGAILCLTKIK